MDSRLLQDNSYHTGPLGPLTVTSHCPRLSRPTFPMTECPAVLWSLPCIPCVPWYPLVSPGVAEWLYRHLYMRLPPSPPQLGLGRRRVNTVTAHSGDITVTCKWLHVYLQTIHHHLLQMTLILDCWSNTYYNYYIVCSVHLHYNQTELFTAKMQSVPRFSLKRFNSHVILMEIFSKLNVMRLVVMYW